MTGILGAFLAFQASRVRFVFDDEGLEVGGSLWLFVALATQMPGSALRRWSLAPQPSPPCSRRLSQVVIGKQAAKSENAFVGGANRWAYDSFTNWEFWWPGFPVLVYFKASLL